MISFIYNSLTDKEKDSITPGKVFINSRYVISRQVLYSNKTKEPAAFAEAYPYNFKSKTKAFIVLAVKKEYRRCGLALNLLHMIINDLKNKGYRTLVYGVKPDNISSIITAQRYGFILRDMGSRELMFELKIH